MSINFFQICPCHACLKMFSVINTEAIKAASETLKEHPPIHTLLNNLFDIQKLWESTWFGLHSVFLFNLN